MATKNHFIKRAEEIAKMLQVELSFEFPDGDYKAYKDGEDRLYYAADSEGIEINLVACCGNCGEGHWTNLTNLL